MFSTRTSWDLGENEFAVKLRAAREEGRELFDLTLSNPTHCGFRYPENLLEPLAQPEAGAYLPEAFGMMPARSAVAAYYASHGAEIDPAQIALTTSTSEAYSFLFRLLCDPGDEVLIARPSYPLFEYIALLDGVTLREYPLQYDPTGTAASATAWHIDLAALAATITSRTRAIIVVHPNNPTGNYASDAERAELEALCGEHSLALIVDEVFLDYALLAPQPRTFAKGLGTGTSPCLTFTLSGLSKVCALPQMKCSWVVTTGPEPAVAEALGRLEVIADTFLSMNAPVQYALPQWLGSRAGIQAQIVERVRENLAALDARLAGTHADRLAVEGGWTAILRVPRTVQGLPFAEAALDAGVVLQPGEFYGLAEGRVVLSLLTQPEIFRDGLARLPID